MNSRRCSESRNKINYRTAIGYENVRNIVMLVTVLRDENDRVRAQATRFFGNGDLAKRGRARANVEKSTRS